MPPPSLQSQVSSSSDVSPPEEYFRHVSPLCRRLLDDMSAVQASWGENWHTLSYHQQCKVIDQAIVDEATVRRYEKGDGTGPECEYFPKLKLPTGQKVVCDENLTARGFSCSWRDEHSAPFSWHTRSQMDLTLDTPPATPTHPGSPLEAPPTSVEGEGRVIPGGRAVYTARPVSLPRPPRFRWHYDPPKGGASPDPPSIVVAAPRSATLPTDLNESKKQRTGKYMLVRDGEENVSNGLLARIRGAVSALTATCLPLKAATGQNSLFSLHKAPENGGEPDLRPPHVRDQAAQEKTRQTRLKDISSPVASNTQSSTLGSDTSSRKTFSTSDNIQSAFSGFSADPTLGGYVCSLPEEEDDVPYTAVQSYTPLNKTATESTTETDSVTSCKSRVPESETSECTAPAINIYTNCLDVTSQCIDSSAGLPTPMPTPTTSDSNKTVLEAPLACSSSYKNSSAGHEDPPGSVILSDPIAETLNEYKRLLQEDNEKGNDKEPDEEIISHSSKRESTIPITGFDFLDNW